MNVCLLIYLWRLLNLAFPGAQKGTGDSKYLPVISDKPCEGLLLPCLQLL